MNAILETRTVPNTSVFTTREEYVAFRAKWKELYANGFHKPVRHEYRYGGRYEPTGELNEYGGKRMRLVDEQTAHYMASPLTMLHHMIFNLALGRDMTKAFGKIRNRDEIRSAIYTAMHYKIWDGLFEVFGETITPEHRKLIADRLKEYNNSI